MADLVWIEKDGQYWQVPPDAVERHLENGFKRSKGPGAAKAEPETQEAAQAPSKAASKPKAKSKRPPK